MSTVKSVSDVMTDKLCAHMQTDASSVECVENVPPTKMKDLKKKERKKSYLLIIFKYLVFFCVIFFWRTYFTGRLVPLCFFFQSAGFLFLIVVK